MTDIFMSPEGLSIDEGLTHQDPTASCLARMTVSTFATTMVDFFNAEMERGTSPVVLLAALARFQVQTHACLVAQFIAPPGVPKALELYEHYLKTDYFEHISRSRVTMQRMARR